MTRVRRIESLLESNRARAERLARPRPELRANDGLPLRARRLPARRETRAVRFARALLVLAFGAFGLGLWHQRVDRIAVEGLLLGPSERVHEACAPLLGGRWLTVDTAAAAVRLVTEPWFERVEFERRAPSTLVVRLREARPLLRLDLGDDAVAVDEHGCMLPSSSSLDVSALPLLVGVEPELGALRPADRERVQRLAYGLANAPWPWEGGLRAIELRAGTEVQLTTHDDIVLRLDENGVVEQLRAAEAAWNRLRLQSGDHVDLRFRRQVVLARAHGASQGG